MPSLSFVRTRTILALAALLVLAFAAYGFANANTMPASSQAGDGSTTISGFTITNIHYTLNTTDPGTIDQVTFAIAPAVPAGGTVTVQITDGAATTWHSCTGGATVTCDLTQDKAATPTSISVLGATNLRVVAAD